MALNKTVRYATVLRKLPLKGNGRFCKGKREGKGLQKYMEIILLIKITVCTFIFHTEQTMKREFDAVTDHRHHNAPSLVSPTFLVYLYTEGSTTESQRWKQAITGQYLSGRAGKMDGWLLCMCCPRPGHVSLTDTLMTRVDFLVVLDHLAVRTWQSHSGPQ